MLFNVVIGMPPGDESNELVSHAMTEGLAVLMERLLIGHLAKNAQVLGLSPRDVRDLGVIEEQRRQWLPHSYHYQEGFRAWRKAYADTGEAGVERLLHALSPRKLTTVERHDGAYLLALAHPETLGAYLSDETQSPRARAIDAFRRAGRGEPLGPGNLRATAALIKEIGPAGWRKVFSETMFSPVFWALPIEPSFVLAKLNPQAAEKLKSLLIRTARHPKSWDRVIGSIGSSTGPVVDMSRLLKIVGEAESLPWTKAQRQTWHQAVGRWLLSDPSARLSR